MSKAVYSKKKADAVDQSIIKNQFSLSRFFHDKSDESRICSRAVRSLHFLCPEVAGELGEKHLHPESLN